MKKDETKKKNLKLWNYKGFIADGRKVKGKIAAYSKKDANDILKQRGRFVSRFSDATPFTATFLKANKEQLSLFLGDLSNKITSGIDIKGTLISMKLLKYDFRLILLIERLIEEIDSGVEFYQALENTKSFDMETIEIVRAGEKSGKLSLVLKELSVLYGERAKTSKAITRSLFKPIGMVIFAFLIIIFVVPRMTEPIKVVYKEMDIAGDGLPMLTRIVLDSVNFIAGWGGIYTAIVVAAFLFLSTVMYKKIFFVKKNWDHFIVWLPLFGEMKKKLFTYVTTLSFSVLYMSSINISVAFRMIAEAQRNEAFKDDLMSVYRSLSDGKDLNIAIEQSLFLSDGLKDRIANGYKDGSLTKELQAAKTKSKEDFDSYTSVFVAGVSGLIGFLISCVIGTIIISIYMPMFDMIGKVMEKI